jgi:hypothetical protein
VHGRPMLDLENFNYRSHAGLRAYVEFVGGESWLRVGGRPCAVRVTSQSTVSGKT